MTAEEEEAMAEGGQHLPPSASGDVSEVKDSAYWNRRYAKRELVWTGKANGFLTAEVENLPPGRALDLAAGEGRNAVWLAERGWRVRAVDFSDVAVGKARRLAEERAVADRVDFEVADLRGYRPEAGAYDLVIVMYLQLPGHELAPILRAAAEAVAPGGTLVVVAHDSKNLTEGYGGPPQAEVLYTAEDVVAALGGDLAIRKAERVERAVKTDDGNRIALDCLVRAMRT